MNDEQFWPNTDGIACVGPQWEVWAQRAAAWPPQYEPYPGPFPGQRPPDVYEHKFGNADVIDLTCIDGIWQEPKQLR